MAIPVFVDTGAYYALADTNDPDIDVPNRGGPVGHDMEKERSRQGACR